jgi:hypothetical protein
MNDMNDMNDEQADPVIPQGYGSDAELEAVLSAADGGILAAIRSGLDLDSGLTQIVGAPLRLEPSPAGTPPLAPLDHSRAEISDCQMGSMFAALLATTGSGAVSSMIARLRFRILELAQDDAAEETATVLLRSAASDLKELNRGLEARELSRQDAATLLDEAAVALDQARAKREPREIAVRVRAAQVRCSWNWEAKPASAADASPCTGMLRIRHFFQRRPGAVPGALVYLVILVSAALLQKRWNMSDIALAVGCGATAAASCGAAVLTRFAAVAVSSRTRARLASKVIEVEAAGAVQASGERADFLRRKLRIQIQATAQLPETFTEKINARRQDLDRVRPGVMKLFDEADDCSPCVPG